jgi:hypothetical protein
MSTIYEQVTGQLKSKYGQLTGRAEAINTARTDVMTVHPDNTQHINLVTKQAGRKFNNNQLKKQAISDEQNRMRLKEQPYSEIYSNSNIASTNNAKFGLNNMLGSTPSSAGPTPNSQHNVSNSANKHIKYIHNIYGKDAQQKVKDALPQKLQGRVLEIHQSEYDNRQTEYNDSMEQIIQLIPTILPYDIIYDDALNKQPHLTQFDDIFNPDKYTYVSVETTMPKNKDIQIKWVLKYRYEKRIPFILLINNIHQIFKSQQHNNYVFNITSQDEFTFLKLLLNCLARKYSPKPGDGNIFTRLKNNKNLSNIVLKNNIQNKEVFTFKFKLRIRTTQSAPIQQRTFIFKITKDKINEYVH